MKKQQLITTVKAYYKTGSIVTYTYEGNGKHNGIMETAEQRAVRQFSNNKMVEHFEYATI